MKSENLYDDLKSIRSLLDLDYLYENMDNLENIITNELEEIVFVMKLKFGLDYYGVKQSFFASVDLGDYAKLTKTQISTVLNSPATSKIKVFRRFELYKKIIEGLFLIRKVKQPLMDKEEKKRLLTPIHYRAEKMYERESKRKLEDKNYIKKILSPKVGRQISDEDKMKKIRMKELKPIQPKDSKK